MSRDRDCDRIREDFAELSPADFMDKRETEQDDDYPPFDPGYSPEASDDTSDWPARFVFGIILIAFIAALVFGFRWALSSAEAQTALHEPLLGHCYPYRDVVVTLFTSFKEVSTGRTLVEQTGTAVEVFISPQGTISVVEVLPSYLACYRAFGSPGEFWGAPPANMVPT